MEKSWVAESPVWFGPLWFTYSSVGIPHLFIFAPPPPPRRGGPGMFAR